MIFKPHDYQQKAIDFLLKNRCAGLFADPGLGKTAITLSVIKRFHKHPKFRGALVIAPLRVIYSVWPAEIQKWNQFNDLTFQILHKSEKFRNIFKKADFYLINVESIFWLFSDEIKKWIKSLNYSYPWNTLIIDESSKFKAYGSKRFKLIRKQLDQFDRRIILTGTPIPNTLIDLFCQMYIVDEGQALTKFITHYQNRFFYAVINRKRKDKKGKTSYIDWMPKPGAHKAIIQQISKQTMRIDAKDHLDLPPIVYNTVIVQLPPKIRKIYKQLEKQFFTRIDEIPVLLGSSERSYNACRQVANGCLYEPIKHFSDGKNRKVLAIHQAKIEALLELISELQGKPVLVAYHYKHDLKQLLDKFGKNTPYFKSGKDDTKIVNDWNAKKIPILLGHPQSIAFGLNLQQGGHDIVWFSLTDNLENYLQFNQRIYRQGVRESVRIHHLIAKDTIDEAIMIRLKKKDKSQNAFLDAIKEYRNDNSRRH